MTAPVTTAGKASVIFAASRPISWINTAYPFAAAYLMGGGSVDTLAVIGTLYFLIPYNLLMYGINDVFDYESDLRNPRKGGVEGIVLDRGAHRATLWAAVLSNVPFVIYLVGYAIHSGTSGAWSAGRATAAIAVLGIVLFAVVAYSAPGLRFKEKPGLDSLTSSTHFVGPAVVGLLFANADFSYPVVAALAAFFLWGAASQAFGAVQDIVADRAGGIASIATWLGASGTVRASMAAYTASAVVMVSAGWPGLLAAVIPVAYAINVAPYRSLPDDECELANAGWRRFLWLNQIAGFLVTLLLIGVALG